MASWTDSGECAHGNWDCLCSSLGLQQEGFFVGYIWISCYSNCAHPLRVFSLWDMVCQWRMCLLVWLGAEGSRCLCREVMVSCGGSYLLNLSVCFLQWLKSSSPYMKATTWRCDYFSARHPLTQTYKKLFAHLSINYKIFNSVSSLPCAVCRFFFLVKRI